MPPSKQENTRLNEVQIQALQSEIDLRTTERKKLELELEKLRSPWYKQAEVLKYGVAGVIVAGLLAAWIVGYFQPIVGAKQELLEIENEIDRLTNERESAKNQKEAEKLKEQNELIKGDLQFLMSRYRTLDSLQGEAKTFARLLQDKYKNLQAEYTKLGVRLRSTETERSELASLAKKLEGEKISAQSNAENLSHELNTFAIRGESVVIYYATHEFLIKASDRLVNAGAIVRATIPRPVLVQGCDEIRIYQGIYGGFNSEAANQIAMLLSDLSISGFKQMRMAGRPPQPSRDFDIWLCK